MDKERLIRYFENAVISGEIPPGIELEPEQAVQALLLYRDGQLDSETWQELCDGIINDLDDAIEVSKTRKHSDQTKTLRQHDRADSYDFITANGKAFFYGIFPHDR